jgi:hypothetical protein
LFEPLTGSSAEVIEKRHCTIKRIAEHTNQRPDWKLQILIHEHRQDETNFQLLDGHATSTVNHDVQMSPIPVLINRQESEEIKGNPRSQLEGRNARIFVSIFDGNKFHVNFIFM